MAGQKNLPLILEVRGVSVKPIKDALEAHHLLDKTIKITPSHAYDNYFSIPLKASLGNHLKAQSDQDENALCHLLASINMEEHLENVSISPVNSQNRNGAGKEAKRALLHGEGPAFKPNHLEGCIEYWLKSIPILRKTLLEGQEWSNKKSGYAIYPPMLLLSPSSFSKYLLDDEISKHILKLYECFCKKFRITHIALNAPIPASSLTETLESAPNIMRSPSGMTTLYGDFGPCLPADRIPTASDFESAFWCSSKQNDIIQTWAPRYSMFSKGNISEKARILNLAKRLSSNQCLNNVDIAPVAQESTAVDLYAGIGYFAFSYLKAGLSKVFCWEINPWSVEALRRGATRNKWETMTVRESDDTGSLPQKINNENSKIIIFQESNDKASGRINALLSRHLPMNPIPPIRHVNCGYLPSSKDSWKTAVDILDKHAGGWIHVHENIGQSHIDARREEIVGIFRKLVDGKFALAGKNQHAGAHSVSCEHLERVKSYAPGVIHCVLDIAIGTTHQQC